MIESKQTKRILGLDVMRSIAIGMVLCSGFISIYPNSSGNLSQIFALFGFWGVEIFFVLSGFLIGNSLYKQFVRNDYTISSVLEFLKRRSFRVLPNYFLVLIVNITLAFILNFYMQDVSFYFLFLQNFAQPMKAFFPESWSLSVGIFAYLLLPFVLLFTSFLIKPKNTSKHYILVVLGLILIFLTNKILYCFTTNNTTIEQWDVSLKSVAIYRVDSVLIGVFASWIHLNFVEFWSKQKRVLFVFGFILLLFMFAGVGFFRLVIDTYPFFWNVLYLPLTSITFALFLPVLSQWEYAFGWFSKPVTFISLISYSVYLLHYSFLLQLMKFCFDTTLFSIYELHFFTFSYLLITFFVSFLLYKYFEKPIMKFGNNRNTIE